LSLDNILDKTGTRRVVGMVWPEPANNDRIGRPRTEISVKSFAPFVLVALFAGESSAQSSGPPPSPRPARTTPTAAAPTSISELRRLRAENDSLRAVIELLRGAPSRTRRGTSPPATAPSVAIPDRPTASHSGELKVEFDRFRNYTTASLSNIPLGKGLNLAAYYLMPGNTPGRPERVIFMLTSSSDDWRYLRCHSIDLLVDGIPYSVGRTDHDGRVGTGYVLEFITFSVPTDEFLRMAVATRVEGKVCNTEFALLPSDMIGMVDLASRMK
jgi:hypothetical protein